MKLAKKDIALILVIVGILAAFCSYKFVFSGKMDEVDAEKTKQSEVQAKLDEVKASASKENDMKADMSAWEKEINDMLAKYKADTKYEDGILYAKALETDLDATIRSYSVAEASKVATVAGAGKYQGKTFVKGSTSYSFSYTVADYDTLKKFINYLVSGNKGVKSLESMSFQVNDDMSISGSVNLSVFVMSDGSTAYEAPKIDGVETGKIPMIFKSKETVEKK